MAIRNTASRRIPGDPLAGLLRETARVARRSSRAPSVAGPPGPQGEPGSDAATTVATLVTGPDGTATWTFPMMAGDACIVATAVAAGPVLVTVVQNSATAATVFAWTVTGQPAPGVTVTAVAFGERVASPLPSPEPELALDPTTVD